MRFNDKELKQLAGNDPIIQAEGILNYMKPQNNDWSDWYQQPAYKERIFKLINNFLFYYRTNEPEEPLGVFVLEHMEVAYESPGPAFAFSLTSSDGKHTFGCRCQEDLNKWVSVLKVASYSYLRSLHEILQVKLERLKAPATNNWTHNQASNHISRQFEFGNIATTNNDSHDLTLITKKINKSTFYSQSQMSSTETTEDDKKCVVITKTNRCEMNNVPVEKLIDL